MSRQPVFGLRDHGQYKLYKRGAVHFASHSDHERLRRVVISAKRSAQLVLQAKPDFCLGIHHELDCAKRTGSRDYYEVKHGRH